MAVVYHWKHGWIPLDHTAALSKAKGSHSLASTYLSAARSHDAGIHSRKDVAGAMLDLPNIHDQAERDNASHQIKAAATQHGAEDLLPNRRSESAGNAKFQAEHVAGFRAHGLNAQGKERAKGGGYTEGDRVERLASDFSKPGHPKVWQSGVVHRIAPDDHGHFDITVLHDDGSTNVQTVGSRGGNNQLRKASTPASAATDAATNRAYHARASMHDQPPQGTLRHLPAGYQYVHHSDGTASFKDATGREHFVHQSPWKVATAARQHAEQQAANAAAAQRNAPKPAPYRGEGSHHDIAANLPTMAELVTRNKTESDRSTASRARWDSLTRAQKLAEIERAERAGTLTPRRAAGMRAKLR